MEIDQLYSEIEKRGKISFDDKEQILKAYKFAKDAHAGQKRKTGDPYFVHCYQTALSLAKWGLDSTTIIAGLLHDTVEDTKVTLDDIKSEFGEEVAFLVDGVTKISRLKYRGNQAQAETLKKMIFALSKDIRVVFIKLADRLHNMRTLGALPIQKQSRIALETTEIYSSLAYRLGLSKINGELEDLSFQYLQPNEYKWLRQTMKDVVENGEKHLQKIKIKIERLLKENKIEIIGVDTRVKRLSSLYKKLKRFGMDLEQIHDLMALRIIVNNISDCYAALGVIHELWPPLPGKIKDYIALPKPNGYRSLHTTVICDNRPTEFQIRTIDMHNENEFGIAAHWAYSEAKKEKKYIDNKTIFADKKELGWISQLKNWQNESNSDDFIKSLKVDFFKDRIFAITPQGEVVDLPAGSTPIDFAYAIHSDVGDMCVGARVNDKIVPLDHILESGDAVQILTQKNKKPSRSWLEYAKSERAKNRIRSSLREKESNLQFKSTDFKITTEDRVGLLKDVTSVFALLKINITSVTSHPLKGSNYRLIRASIPTGDKDKIDKVILRLKKIPEIKQINYTTSN